MANFLRMLLGVALLPMCWGVVRAFYDSVLAAAGDSGGVTAESIALVGGMVAFVLCWMAVPHPVKTYVLGHTSSGTSSRMRCGGLSSAPFRRSFAFRPQAAA